MNNYKYYSNPEKWVKTGDDVKGWTDLINKYIEHNDMNYYLSLYGAYPMATGLSLTSVEGMTFDFFCFTDMRPGVDSKPSIGGHAVYEKWRAKITENNKKAVLMAFSDDETQRVMAKNILEIRFKDDIEWINYNLKIGTSI